MCKHCYLGSMLAGSRKRKKPDRGSLQVVLLGAFGGVLLEVLVCKHCYLGSMLAGSRKRKKPDRGSLQVVLLGAFGGVLLEVLVCKHCYLGSMLAGSRKRKKPDRGSLQVVLLGAFGGVLLEVLVCKHCYLGSMRVTSSGFAWGVRGGCCWRCLCASTAIWGLCWPAPAKERSLTEGHFKWFCLGRSGGCCWRCLCASTAIWGLCWPAPAKERSLTEGHFKWFCFYLGSMLASSRKRTKPDRGSLQVVLLGGFFRGVLLEVLVCKHCYLGSMLAGSRKRKKPDRGSLQVVLLGAFGGVLLEVLVCKHCYLGSMLAGSRKRKKPDSGSLQASLPGVQPRCTRILVGEKDLSVIPKWLVPTSMEGITAKAFPKARFPTHGRVDTWSTLWRPLVTGSQKGAAAQVRPLCHWKAFCNNCYP